MSLDNFLNNNQEYEDEHEGEDEHKGEDEQEEGVQEGEDREENDEIYEVGEDINHQNEQVDESNNSTEQDRMEIIFNEYGVPIGPDQRIVIQFNNFLGTVARSSDLCPLVYTNWKDVPDKDLIWTYVKVLT
ncbi:hypothetical protein TanjilG_30911 [Lupinus angustifolius]|uniref:Uncharacterized protein n=1 Tax=Lupinus angustifolius TaxID=3871 RepID=A0A394D9M2_LUPAN|nr:hypothetical protein TanjilG_30911 [Lupinus angustifolius]